MAHELEWFIGLRRRDFGMFVERCFYELNAGTPYLLNWHIGLIIDQVWQAASGKGQRLIINLPPRHLKSLIVSIALPAFLLGHDPSCKIISVSYSQDLSDNLSRQCRQIIKSEWYKQLFPRTRLADKASLAELTTTAGGYRLATSTGGTLTGRGGDIIIMDDPQKPDQAISEAGRAAAIQWYSNTLLSRLDSKEDGNLILVMQRLHEEDLSGFVEAQGGWRTLRLPAIAIDEERHHFHLLGKSITHVRREGEALHPARESLARLEITRKTMGESAFSAQYQQMPLPPGGGIIKTKWLQYYSELPAGFNRIVCSWDCASTAKERSDYSACTVWGVKAGTYYLLEAFRRQMEYPDLKRAVVDMAAKHNAQYILIEDTSAGISLAQELKALGRFKIVPVKPGINDKEVRTDHQSAKFEAGQVLLPIQAVWLGDYIRELTGFPNTKNDDQVDSTVQFLGWVTDFKMNAFQAIAQKKGIIL